MLPESARGFVGDLSGARARLELTRPAGCRNWLAISGVKDAPQLMVLLAVFERALAAPALLYAATAKYQVPLVSPVTR